MANNAIMIFDGTPTVVLTGVTGALLDTNYTTTSTATYITYDNSTDLWPLAKATFTGAFTAAPTAKATIDLYYTETNLNGGTDDETVPTISDKLGARYVGSFIVPGTATSSYSIQIIISTLGFQKGQFHIYNGAGGTSIAIGTPWTVEVEGFTFTSSV
jgi:hypothetical protein